MGTGGQAQGVSRRGGLLDFCPWDPGALILLLGSFPSGHRPATHVPPALASEHTEREEK